MEMGRGWQQELGVVDTIYEEEENGECFDSPAMSSSAATSRSCSPPAPPAAARASLPPALRRAVKAW
jgi:hypothetical protein